MDHIFEIIDKSGRKIRLTRAQYEHILRHKGMEQHLDDIVKILIKPLTIVTHEKESIVDYYGYLKHRNPTLKYLKVVVNTREKFIVDFSRFSPNP